MARSAMDLKKQAFFLAFPTLNRKSRRKVGRRLWRARFRIVSRHDSHQVTLLTHRNQDGQTTRHTLRAVCRQRTRAHQPIEPLATQYTHTLRASAGDDPRRRCKRPRYVVRATPYSGAITGVASTCSCSTAAGHASPALEHEDRLSPRRSSREALKVPSGADGGALADGFHLGSLFHTLVARFEPEDRFRTRYL